MIVFVRAVFGRIVTVPGKVLKERWIHGGIKVDIDVRASSTSQFRCAKTSEDMYSSIFVF